ERVIAEIEGTPDACPDWPNSIHDALAAAGAEMSRLGTDRQSSTNEFAAWLVGTLGIDEDRFSGITYLRGGQAIFDEMGWAEFNDLLGRNERTCRVSPEKLGGVIKPRYLEVSHLLQQNRQRFKALAEAIDIAVWRLVGLRDAPRVP
ncbi:MAG TPA: hypothetical protein PK867_07345, partial [Pirellulales bacterium]|nr:hypothetical protein [Pirellulales bacterium]